MKEKDWLEWESKIITATALISDQPLWLSAVIQTLNSSHYGNTLFYNGIDDNGELKLAAGYTVHASGQIMFNTPMFFSRGLYIVMVYENDYVTVQYKLKMR